jgi:hypothetical protein
VLGSAKFLLCSHWANAEIGALHLKVMLIIVATPAEIETWTTAGLADARQVSGPLLMGR